MTGIEQVILAADVLDVDIIVVIPIRRPSVGVLESVAAVLKAAVIAALHAEAVLASKAGAIRVVGNPATGAFATAFVLPAPTIVLFCTTVVFLAILILNAVLFA